MASLIQGMCASDASARRNMGSIEDMKLWASARAAPCIAGSVAATCVNASAPSTTAWRRVAPVPRRSGRAAAARGDARSCVLVKKVD